MAMNRTLALLRGINVGGKNVLPMEVLRRLFVEAGCLHVETYIQSGNVVFSAPDEVRNGLADRVRTAIEAAHGLKVPVVLRSIDQLRAVATGNPYLTQGADESTLHVMFLSNIPDTDSIQTLDPARSPGDSYQIISQDIFIHLPNGVANSKLTNAYFDSRLKTTGTQRNWRTVTKLLEMLEADPVASKSNPKRSGKK